ncbi:hypothetical protein [Microbacterium aureliae]
MDARVDGIVEIFSWIGFGAGALLAGVALVLYLFDGTWVPARAVLEDGPDGRLARWFDEDGGVNEAPLTHEQAHALAGKDMADVFHRRGARNRLRLTQGSPVVRGVALLAVGFLGLGALALTVSAISLFAG